MLIYVQFVCVCIRVCACVCVCLISCVNHSVCSVNECLAGVVIVVVDFYVAINYMRLHFYLLSFFEFVVVISFFYFSFTVYVIFAASVNALN